MPPRTPFYSAILLLIYTSAFAQDSGLSTEGQARPKLGTRAPAEPAPEAPAPASPAPEIPAPPAPAPSENEAPQASEPPPSPSPAGVSSAPEPAKTDEEAGEEPEGPPPPAQKIRERPVQAAEDAASASQRPAQAPKVEEIADAPPVVEEGEQLKSLEAGQVIMNAPAGAELSPSLLGYTGVFRTVSARNGGRNSMRFGIHTGGYYLTHEWDDANQAHLEGQGHIAYSILDELEVHLDGIGTGHRIIPNDDEKSEFLQTLGDVSLGGKYVYKFYDYLSAGGLLDFRFYTKMRAMGFRWGSFSVLPMGVVTFDAREQPDMQWPLVAHANLGYFIDNSSRVLFDQEGDGLAVDASITASRLTALNVRTGNQLVLNVAFEFPQDVYTVFLEYTTEQEMNNKVQRGVRKGHWDQSPQRFTPGVRWNFVDRMILDFALDLSYGLADEYTVGRTSAIATTPYQLWLGLAYSYDPEAHKVLDTRGFVKGIVVDAETGEPIGGAVVQYPGNTVTRQVTRLDDGNFTSFPLLPGQAKVRVVAEKYEPVVITPTVLSRETITEKILLRKIDEGGQLVGALVGTVLDATAKPVQATLAFVDQDIAGTRSNPVDGSFVKILPPGQYKVRVEAEGYDTKVFLVPIEARRKTKVVFELPSVGAVSVGALAGILMDPTGKPVGGILHFPEGNVKDILVNGDTGEFYATLPPGRYKIEVQAEGFGKRDYLIPIEVGKKTRVDIKLVSTAAVGAIAGRLLGAGDQPVAGFVRFADPAVGTLPVDPSTGGFTKVLPAGTYDVEIGGPGFKNQNIKIQVLDRKKTVQDFYLDSEDGGAPGLATLVGTKIELARQISFAKDSTNLSAEDREILDAVYDIMRNNTQKIVIRAYTDDEGPAKSNFRSTQVQAEAVADYLASKGIAKDRMTSVGGGEEKPLFSNDSPENRAKNRRIEFQVK